MLFALSAVACRDIGDDAFHALDNDLDWSEMANLLRAERKADKAWADCRPIRLPEQTSETESTDR